MSDHSVFVCHQERMTLSHLEIFLILINLLGIQAYLLGLEHRNEARGQKTASLQQIEEGASESALQGNPELKYNVMRGHRRIFLHFAQFLESPNGSLSSRQHTRLVKTGAKPSTLSTLPSGPKSCAPLSGSTSGAWKRKLSHSQIIITQSRTTKLRLSRN